jgi:L-xylulokinase
VCSSDLFLPFLYGTNVGKDAQACFLGLKGAHNRAHVLRAIYEGVIFAHKMHIEKLLALREPPRAIRLTGGAARSAAWVQMFADVLQVPIEITAGTELGALGAAICAGVATGRFPSFEQAVESMVHVSRGIAPDAAKKDVYARKYAAYRRAIETLEPYWASLADS